MSQIENEHRIDLPYVESGFRPESTFERGKSLSVIVEEAPSTVIPVTESVVEASDLGMRSIAEYLKLVTERISRRTRV